MIHTVNTTIQRCEIALNRVRGNDHAILALHIFSGPVIDLIVFAAHQCAFQDKPLSVMMCASSATIVSIIWPQVLSRDSLDMPRLHTTVALHCRTGTTGALPE